MRIKTTTPENRAKAEKLRKDVAAYDALRVEAKRALRPPPLRADTQTVTSGARALSRDIKVGVYAPGRALVGHESMQADGYAGSYQVSRALRVAR